MGFFIFLLIAVFIVYAVVAIMRQERPAETQNDANLLADAALLMQKIEAMTQADEAGHEDVKAQIMTGIYQGDLPEKRSDGAWTSIFDDLRILTVAGINHREGIRRYMGRNTVALVPEPKNEFDPQAIKVLAEDGHHLGYVQRHQTEMVRSWAINHFPMYCVCRIEEHEDNDDGHKFFVGYLYIKKSDC